MARTPRIAWQKHIAAWSASGLTARQFAARIGVNPNTLAHWKWRLAAEAEAPTDGASFIEISAAVVSAAGGADDRLEVVCRGGRAVRVPRDFDAATLVRVLDALEGR